MTIFPCSTFDVGRQFVQEMIDTHDMAISVHHLRFRCVSYEDEPEGPHQLSVPALTYVRVLSSNNVAFTPAGDDETDGIALSKDSGDTLLNHGDRLQLTPDVMIYYGLDEAWQVALTELDPTVEAESRCFGTRYRLTDRKLGFGGMAVVYLGLKIPSRRQLACKVIRRPLPEASQTSIQGSTAVHDSHVKTMDRLAREYELLKNITHVCARIRREYVTSQG